MSLLVFLKMDRMEARILPSFAWLDPSCGVPMKIMPRVCLYISWMWDVSFELASEAWRSACWLVRCCMGCGELQGEEVGGKMRRGAGGGKAASHAFADKTTETVSYEDDGTLRLVNGELYWLENAKVPLVPVIAD